MGGRKTHMSLRQTTFMPPTALAMADIQRVIVFYDHQCPLLRFSEKSLAFNSESAQRAHLLILDEKKSGS